ACSASPVPSTPLISIWASLARVASPSRISPGAQAAGAAAGSDVGSLVEVSVAGDWAATGSADDPHPASNSAAPPSAVSADSREKRRGVTAGHPIASTRPEGVVTWVTQARAVGGPPGESG